MSGDEESRDVESGNDRQRADRQQAARRDLMAGLRTQLISMRSQVRRLSEALRQAETLRVAAYERLQGLRGTADRIEQALRCEEEMQRRPSPGVSPPADLDDALPGCWRPVAEAGQGFKRHFVAIDLRPEHTQALLASGVLSPAEVDDSAKVGTIVQVLLDHWCRQIGTGGGDVVPPASDPNAAAGDPANSRDRWQPAPYHGDRPLFGRRSPRQRQEPPVPSAAAPLPHAQGPHAPGLLVPGAAAAGGNVFRLDVLRGPGARSPRAGRLDRVQGVDNERGPDQRKRDETLSRKRFAVDEHGQQEVAGRGDVLQQADGCQPNAPRAGDE
jgi:hypothetical protein